MSRFGEGASVLARVPGAPWLARRSQVWRASHWEQPARRPAPAVGARARPGPGRGGRPGGGHDHDFVRGRGRRGRLRPRAGRGGRSGTRSACLWCRIEQGADAVAVAYQADARLGVASAGSRRGSGHDLLGCGGDAPRSTARRVRVGSGRAAARPGPRRAGPGCGARTGRTQAPASVSRGPAPVRGDQGDAERLRSAATEADTAAWVTTSSSAAARTEPRSATARKLRSWLRVIGASPVGSIKKIVTVVANDQLSGR